MGIRGLTTFLDINSQLLTDFKLRDCHVIIDGNNLFHFLYNLYSLYDGCGGDYDDFGAATKSFFTILRQCNVEALVVFDGPYNPKEKKIYVSIRRAKDRIQTAANISAGGHGKATPILCQDVFISTLSEMQVKHATCEGEADPNLAALANKYNWPVMTNDSDFFIYNLRAGAIPLDYVNLQVKNDKEVEITGKSEEERSSPYIDVQIYYFSRLNEHFKMDEDMIILFGTIFGNDRVSIQVFGPFFAKVRLSKQGSYKLFAGPKQAQMLGILQWLEAAGDLETALEKILICYKQDRREKLQKMIMDSVNSYKIIPEPSQHLLNVVESSEGVMLSTLKTYAHHPLPAWFIEELYQGKVSALAINALVSRKVILQSQPENFTISSAYDCAKSLRKILYGVIMQYDRQYHNDNGSEMCPDTCPSNCLKNGYVEEIDRVLKNQKRNHVEPKLVLNDAPVPSLADVPHLDQAERMKIISSSFGVDPEILGSFPKGLELYFLCIVFWINHAQPKVNIMQLTSVLMCLLKIQNIDQISIDSSGSVVSLDPENIAVAFRCGNISKLIQKNCSEEKLKTIKQCLKVYTIPSRNKNQSIVAGTNALHLLSQLQACMFAAQALNQVLGTALDRIPIANVFNATFIFNLYKDLRGRKFPENHLIDVLGGVDILKNVIDLMKDVVIKYVDQGALITDMEADTKHSKKKKCSKNKAKIDKNESDEENTVEDEKKLKLLAKCKIVNRFDCLMLDQ